MRRLTYITTADWDRLVKDDPGDRFVAWRRREGPAVGPVARQITLHNHNDTRMHRRNNRFSPLIRFRPWRYINLFTLLLFTYNHFSSTIMYNSILLCPSDHELSCNHRYDTPVKRPCIYRLRVRNKDWELTWKSYRNRKSHTENSQRTGTRLVRARVVRMSDYGFKVQCPGPVQVRVMIER